MKVFYIVVGLIVTATLAHAEDMAQMISSVADRAVMKIFLDLAIEETRKEGGSLRPIARLSGKQFPDLESRKSVVEKSGHHAIGL